jgi:acyl dehydratase
VGQPVVVQGVEGLQALVGHHVGATDWVAVAQDRVDRFADATGDHQWIHVDVERATRESPYGGPVAHGYLTLSLVSMLLPQLWQVEGFAMGVNYGLDELRFPAPVPVGSRLRLGADVVDVEAVSGGVQVVLDLTIETDGGAKPSLVARGLFRYYF